uniref:HisKA_7TM domain-containing protein n=1 Tax=Syphacia muris TaxID=451379 RepID=A0A0N5AGV7_9BILA
MPEALVSGPARLLAIYGGITGLAYVETDGFRRSASFIMIVPLLLLGFLTLSLNMRWKTKLLTGFSFFAAAVGIYLRFTYRKRINLIATFLSLAHLLYFLSFLPCLKRLWHGLAIVMTTVYCSLLYYCFADLFRSIPSAVIFFSTELGMLCASVVAAGSVWHYGSKRTDAQEAALLRFIGLIILFCVTSQAVINQFAYRLNRTDYLLSIGIFASEGLLFFANERAF